MTDKRVTFDFEIEFTNGGGIQGQDFRLDEGFRFSAVLPKFRGLGTFPVRAMATFD